MRKLMMASFAASSFFLSPAPSSTHRPSFPPHERQRSMRKSDDPTTESRVRTDVVFLSQFSPMKNCCHNITTVAQPILIPTTPVNRWDPDRVPTPLSGRGDRKGHLFPIKDSSPTRLVHFGGGQEAFGEPSPPPPPFNHTYHHRTLSHTLSPRSRSFAMMHSDRASFHYTPTSPLSPRLEMSVQPISPQLSRPRNQASRPMNLPIPKYHPLHFPQQRNMPAANTSTSSNPVVNFTKRASATESPRLMKERQREFINTTKISSRIAASPHGVKPDSPRLGPLGSPKGPVTPLALEETGDYFLAAGSGDGAVPGSPDSRNVGLPRDAGVGGCVKLASKKDGG